MYIKLVGCSAIQIMCTSVPRYIQIRIIKLKVSIIYVFNKIKKKKIIINTHYQIFEVSLFKNVSRVIR